MLFFEAFNNHFHGGHRHFPENIQQALQMAPYLNGGLFKPNRLDTHPPTSFIISDAGFKQAFDFLEKYNFTIAEDSPLDQEVAVDPEMIGKVYESLVNVSSEADERGDAGIFYTPRTEIDLMCRLALVDNLANHLGQQHKNLLYEVVFALEPDDKEAADHRLQNAGLWGALYHRLQETTVVDPACGSGSFLVGMLYILDDLQTRAQQQLNRHEDSYDRKKRIIGQSLYGVDVMEWACHVAELRLWLALIIDADIDTTQAHVRKEPLLPHFSFKIRCGDSLVQEVGGINMAHLKGLKLVPPPLKRKITHHKQEKSRFYNSDEDREYKTEEQVLEAELRLFREILEAQDQALQQQIDQLNRKITGACNKTIDGTMTVPGEMQGKVAQWQQQVQELITRQERLAQTRQALRTAQDVPFVWDIAFVEIFNVDDEGFDIVVGNPPYVRQEKIADPCEREEDFSADAWRERKKLYKAKLAQSVYQTYPQHFGDTGQTRKLNAKSDLYCYFYFHALSLLNSRGAFTFVTSNSWLDVGYGADLQEFLLRNCRLRFILDNQVRRTFTEADVNTVIVLFSAPQFCKAADGIPPEDLLSHAARFVMFTVPFEQVVDAVIFEEIEEAAERRTTPDYRVFPISQQRLLEAGLQLAEEEEDRGSEACGREDERRRRGRRASGSLIGVPKYSGDKWGGKYLRAPDIYWRILEKGKGKLVRLGDIAEVRFGIKTGANDFFYVKIIGETNGDNVRVITDINSEHDLPYNILAPAIVRPGNICRPLMTPDTADYHIVCIPPLPQTELPKLVQDYIQWGEDQGFHKRATLRSRRIWYSIERRDPGWVLLPMIRSRRPLIGWNDSRLQVDHNLFEILPNNEDGQAIIAASLLSTFTVMQAELLGRANLGQGALKTEGVDIALFAVLNPKMLSEAFADRLSQSLAELAVRRILMIYDDVRTLDRCKLDNAFLTAVGFTDAEERDGALRELQKEACRMVWRRQAKPGNTRESRQTYDEWLASGEPFGRGLNEDDDA